MDHSKIITAAAREILRPAGLIQKGRSRTWLDDHGWWMVVVEFQPSSWDRGSYLNVGVMWLLYPKDYIAFDDGDREHGFVAARDEEQFRRQADAFCRTALARVHSFRERLTSFAAAQERMEEKLREGQKRSGVPNPWHLYEAGALALAAGRGARGLELLGMLQDNRPTYDWEREVQRVGKELAEAADPRAMLARHVRATRAALKLPEIAVGLGT